MLIETLTQEEARVLGTLMEKSLATPDYYPMTLNSLRNACNQKSSRDPVTEYDDDTVSLALSGLKRKCLVTFIPYGSQGNNYKYRHFLEDIRFNLRKPEMAVLAVLLLRGSQTLNEIKLRASSLHPIDSLEEAETVLKGLAERDEPLAEPVPKRPGWKEPRWRDLTRTHGEDGSALGEWGQETARVTGDSTPGNLGAAGPAGSSTGQGANQIGRSKWDEFEVLKLEVAELKAQYAALKEIVERMRSELGA
ncbi:MAG: DUF480 domain-containing protein [Fibrobacterota bacterium]|nr:DUF480 domain-containing protein [Fibrobacterota bacterium]